MCSLSIRALPAIGPYVLFPVLVNPSTLPFSPNLNPDARLTPVPSERPPNRSSGLFTLASIRVSSLALDFDLNPGTYANSLAVADYKATPM